MDQSVRIPTGKTVILHGEDPSVSQQLYEITVAANDGHTTWKPASFQSELEQEQSLYIGFCQEGKLVGYIGSMSVLDEVSVNNFAVLPAAKRQGIGSQLLDALLGLCQQRGFHRVWLEVRVSNQPALRLYQKFGFEEVAVRKKYYTNPVEDALLMQCVLPENHEENQEEGVKP